MLSTKLAYRLARYLQDAYEAKARNPGIEARPIFRHILAQERAFHRARIRWLKAHARGFTLALPQLGEWLNARSEELSQAVVQVQALVQAPPQAAPALGFLLAEFQQLEDEFGELRVDWKGKSLAVTTDPITLQQVPLGAFEIQLHWQRLSQGVHAQCFDVVALTPNRPDCNEHVTHPHVKDDSLCAGDANASLQKALAEGRLADAYCLVQSVLSHYNPSSPHVRLDEWEGAECHDCGSYVSEEDIYRCDDCERIVCSECETTCSKCRCTLCASCEWHCGVCEEPFCGGCLKPSAHSERGCCADCLKPCANCQSMVADDELDEEGRRCPACQKKQSSLPSMIPTPDFQEQETVDENPHLAMAAP